MKTQKALLLIILLSFSPLYTHNNQDTEALVKLGGTLLVLSLITGVLWYDKLSPYKPLLCITKEGIASSNKSLSWQELEFIQKNVGEYMTYVDLVFNLPNDKNDRISVNTAYLPFPEDKFLDFINEYKKKALDDDNRKPPFVKNISEEQLFQIKKTGFYQDDAILIICYHKYNWLPLIGISSITYGPLIGAIAYIKFLESRTKQEITDLERTFYAKEAEYNEL